LPSRACALADATSSSTPVATLAELKPEDEATLQTRVGEAAADPMGELFKKGHDFIECEVTVLTSNGCRLRNNPRVMPFGGDESFKAFLAACWATLP
jgi:hypothetical protein